ncbi:MAG: hypothetical protein U9R23_00150 [Candidatus Cloacimonadota bacterium]|nr:hypothetical protein [Candidatus Cloacimonadota bacterium]
MHKLNRRKQTEKGVLICITTIVILLTFRDAIAIPPPRYIEETKAKSDLIIIGKTTNIDSVVDIKGYELFSIGINPIVVLKGKIPEKSKQKDRDSTFYLLFSRIEEPTDKGNGKIIDVAIVGDTPPQPREEETVLIFLKKHLKEGYFLVAGGSDGYIHLDTDSTEKLIELKKEIELYREWCRQIKNVKISKTMNSYYLKTLEFLEENNRRKR